MMENIIEKCTNTTQSVVKKSQDTLCNYFFIKGSNKTSINDSKSFIFISPRTLSSAIKRISPFVAAISVSPRGVRAIPLSELVMECNLNQKQLSTIPVNSNLSLFNLKNIIPKNISYPNNLVSLELVTDSASIEYVDSENSISNIPNTFHHLIPHFTNEIENTCSFPCEKESECQLSLMNMNDVSSTNDYMSDKSLLSFNSKSRTLSKLSVLGPSKIPILKIPQLNIEEKINTTDNDDFIYNDYEYNKFHQSLYENSSYNVAYHASSKSDYSSKSSQYSFSKSQDDDDDHDLLYSLHEVDHKMEIPCDQSNIYQYSTNMNNLHLSLLDCHSCDPYLDTNKYFTEDCNFPKLSDSEYISNTKCSGSYKLNLPIKSHALDHDNDDTLGITNIDLCQLNNLSYLYHSAGEYQDSCSTDFKSKSVFTNRKPENSNDLLSNTKVGNGSSFEEKERESNFDNDDDNNNNNTTFDSDHIILNFCSSYILSNKDVDSPRDDYDSTYDFDTFSKGKLLTLYRYECNEIIKGSRIYISGIMIAKDWKMLSKHGITHIINVADDISSNIYTDKIQYLSVLIQDTRYGSEELRSIIYPCLIYMHERLGESPNNKILVHCKEGISRSGSLVIGYLMWKTKMCFSDILKIICLFRPTCNPNTGFTYILLRFEKLLQLTLNHFKLNPNQRMKKYLSSDIKSADIITDNWFILKHLRHFDYIELINQTELESSLTQIERRLLVIVPHNSNASFLVVLSLFEFDHKLKKWTPSLPNQFLDSRFYFILKNDHQICLWKGSQSKHQEITELYFLYDYLSYLHIFEGNNRKWQLVLINEGNESEEFLTFFNSASNDLFHDTKCGHQTIQYNGISNFKLIKNQESLNMYYKIFCTQDIYNFDEYYRISNYSYNHSNITVPSKTILSNSVVEYFVNDKIAKSLPSKSQLNKSISNLSNDHLSNDEFSMNNPTQLLMDGVNRFNNANNSDIIVNENIVPFNSNRRNDIISNDTLSSVDNNLEYGTHNNISVENTRNQFKLNHGNTDSDCISSNANENNDNRGPLSLNLNELLNNESLYDSKVKLKLPSYENTHMTFMLPSNRSSYLDSNNSYISHTKKQLSPLPCVTEGNVILKEKTPYLYIWPNFHSPLDYFDDNDLLSNTFCIIVEYGSEPLYYMKLNPHDHSKCVFDENYNWNNVVSPYNHNGSSISSYSNNLKKKNSKMQYSMKYNNTESFESGLHKLLPTKALVSETISEYSNDSLNLALQTKRSVDQHPITPASNDTLYSDRGVIDYCDSIYPPTSIVSERQYFVKSPLVQSSNSNINDDEYFVANIKSPSSNTVKSYPHCYSLGHESNRKNVMNSYTKQDTPDKNIYSCTNIWVWKGSKWYSPKKNTSIPNCVIDGISNHDQAILDQFKMCHGISKHSLNINIYWEIENQESDSFQKILWLS